MLRNSIPAPKRSHRLSGNQLNRTKVKYAEVMIKCNQRYNGVQGDRAKMENGE
ncbi:MAG: hypothetical protein GDA48_24015 [Hormoscilla sp. GM102CHS1]|nr:hypothetical protein [Hormoscilla sp. GM102CHS1]